MGIAVLGQPRIITAIALISERNIVLHVLQAAGGLLRRRLGLAPWRRCALGARFRRAAALARTQHLHGVAADLGRVVRLPVLVVLARAQAALDVDLRALFQVLAR